MNFNAAGNGKSLSVSMICKFSALTGWNTLDEFWSNCRTLVNFEFLLGLLVVAFMLE